MIFLVAQTRHSHNHSHTHNYNELDPTLMCIGKNCPTHGNMSRSSSKNGKTNSSGTEEALTDSPKGKLNLRSEIDECGHFSLYQLIELLVG